MTDRDVMEYDVAIVGGGPAGLACAHDLARWGYRVSVYEATDRLGGAMWLGIPEYRLDRSVLQGDIDAIVDLAYTRHRGDIDGAATERRIAALRARIARARAALPADGG